MAEAFDMPFRAGGLDDQPEHLMSLRLAIREGRSKARKERRR